MIFLGPSSNGNDVAQVRPDDLKQLRVIHDLLATLNDQYASRGRIEQLCRAMPVLAKRVLAHARVVSPLRDIRVLQEALTVIGNRGVESVLLGLLEDLTMLKADLDDPMSRKLGA